MQRNIIKATKTFTKRDVINSVNGMPLQDNTGMTIVAVSACLMETIEDDGTTRNVSVLRDDDNNYYTSISSAIYSSTDSLIELIDDEGKVPVTIEKRTSKSGRPYLVMFIL